VILSKRCRLQCHHRHTLSLQAVHLSQPVILQLFTHMQLFSSSKFMLFVNKARQVQMSQLSLKQHNSQLNSRYGKNSSHCSSHMHIAWNSWFCSYFLWLLELQVTPIRFRFRLKLQCSKIANNEPNQRVDKWAVSDPSMHFNWAKMYSWTSTANDSSTTFYLFTFYGVLLALAEYWWVIRYCQY